MRTRTKALIGAGAGMLAALVTFWARRQARAAYDLSNVGSCPKCVKLMKVRAGLSFMRHLEEDHGCDEETAIETVIAAYKRILKR